MRKTLAATLALVMVLSVFPAGLLRASALIGDYSYTVADSQATITKYKGSDTDVTIPETLGGYPVTEIGKNAFEYNARLIRLIIPDNIKIIGSSAFFKCTELVSVTIGSGVSGIGMPAFAYCEKLTQLTVDSGNNYYSSQDDVIFNKAKTSLIQCAVGKAGDYAIPEGVTTIGNFAFFYCEKLTGISIPKSLTTIGYKALYLCRAMNRYAVDSENNSFSCRDDILFNKDKTLLIACPSNKSGKYVVPDTVTEIYEKAFYSCSKLSGVTLPNGLKTIGSEAFSGCSCLDSLTIPDSVTSIKRSAFSSCAGLKELTFGSGLTTIENFAFSGCKGLTNLTIGNSVTEIKSGAFYYCNGLTAIILPENLISIGTDAFFSCDSLKDVTIPNKVTAVGDTAFSSCDELTGVTIGDHVKNIGTNAFGDCTKLTSAYFLGDAPLLNTGVFSRCASAFRVYTIRGQVGFSNNWYGYGTAYFVPTPILTVSPSEPVMNSATVIVSFFNDATVKEYKIGDGDWTLYTSPIVLNSNAIVYARCSDAEGYYSANGSLVVSNIIQSTGNSYTVSYNGNGSTSGNTAVSAHAFDVTANLTVNGFVRTGYSFLGWSTDSGAASAIYTDGQNVLNLTQTPDTIITLYAVWSVNQYTITFDANGGTGSVPPITLDYNTGYDLPKTGFTRTGYTFKSWNTSPDATGIYSFYDYNVPAHDVTYYALWTPVQYTITFDSTGGSPVHAITKYYTNSAAKPADPGKEGYVFGGWYFDAELTNAVTWPYVIAGDITFFAKWDTGISYTVTFDATGGSVSPNSKTVIGGSIYGNLPTPTKKGYVFAGWYFSPPSGWSYDYVLPSSLVTNSNHTIYAKWSDPTYNLSFDPNGGSGGMYFSYSIPADTFVSISFDSEYMYVDFVFPDPSFYLILPAVMLEPPTRQGYTFMGWSMESFIMPAHDVTLSAIWYPKSPVTITFNASGGTGGTSVQMIPGNALTPPANPTKAGYTFTGWAPSVPPSVPDDDTTYTAQWQINSYMITFDANGGTGGTEDFMEYGEAITPPAVARAGYIFTGWSPSVPAMVGDEDAIFAAQWNLFGDIGNDAQISSLDALMVLQAASGKISLTATQLLVADVDKNNSVSSVDALKILQFSTGLITSF